MDRSIWIGFDPRESDAFAVARATCDARHKGPIATTKGLVLSKLRAHGLYYRPTEIRDGRLWDVISEAPMATEFAISRFLVPHLARWRADKDELRSRKAGWALFMDCDMLVRGQLDELFAYAEGTRDKYAVMCVKHQHTPPEGVKMDGQAQLLYARKNWSSVMLFNCDHPANDALTVHLVNSVPGRDLHRFCWLKDEQIGELNVRWNYLVGDSRCESLCNDPAIVHFTEGIPSMKGYENQPYADEWRERRDAWAMQ